MSIGPFCRSLLMSVGLFCKALLLSKGLFGRSFRISNCRQWPLRSLLYFLQVSFVLSTGLFCTFYRSLLYFLQLSFDVYRTLL